MQFIDLKAQQTRIREKIETNIKKVLDHGNYIMGPEINQIEELLAHFVGTKYAISVASGTDALLMPLMAHEIGRGDAVFTTPFTFIATAEVIQLLGATPVFADILPDTYNIDPEKLEITIKKTIAEGKLKPKAIIPVDLFGQAADYDEIHAIAAKYDLLVLQDAAQSFGAAYKGKKTCANGHVAGTSFFPAKPLGAYGDGGMIFTNDSQMMEKLVSIRIHGKGSDKYDNIRIGINGRMDTMQAAILLAKMEIFPEEINLRQEKAQYYSNGLKNSVTVPVIRDYNVSAWAQYSILHPQRERVMNALKEQGIPTAVYYPLSLHLQGAFKHLPYQAGDFPISESISQQIFSIPMHPYLKKEEQDKIIQVINSVNG